MFPGMMKAPREVESIDTFLKRLPAFVGRPATYSVLMTSYNGIIGVREGQSVGMSGSRLDVTIHVGGTEGLMAASGGEANAQKAQALVEKNTRFDGRLFDLAVVYVGLNVFESSLRFARGLKRYGKAKRVVVLTCDCNLPEKRTVLEPLMVAGELTAAVWTKECGGHRDMRAILDRLEACFPPGDAR